MEQETAELTQIATLAALQAGEILRQGFHTNFAISSKAGNQNFVTEYDTKSEDAISSYIQSQRPNDTLIGEEGGERVHKEGAISWVIDPLDGTVNFAYGIPAFTVSIAAVCEKEVVSGVIYQPITHELFVAEKQKGAFLNGTPIKVSKKTDLNQSLFATGLPYFVKENPGSCIDILADVLHQGWPIRRIGSAALDLAYLAAGRFDLFWEISLHGWDYAAGKLLVEEAGGIVTDIKNRPIKDPKEETSLLASNGPLHNPFREKIKKYDTTH